MEDGVVQVAVTDSHKTSPNGCTVARCMPRKSVEWRQPSAYIAAIDFGVSNCSVAYVVPGKINPHMLPLDDTMCRIPTTILFNNNGTLNSFGWQARTRYYNLDDGKRLEYAYFDHIKMDLQHDQVT